MKRQAINLLKNANLTVKSWLFGEILIFGYNENEKFKFHWYATLFNLDDFTAKCKFIVLSQVNGMLLTVKNFC